MNDMDRILFNQAAMLGALAAIISAIKPDAEVIKTLITLSNEARTYATRNQKP